MFMSCAALCHMYWWWACVFRPPTVLLFPDKLRRGTHFFFKIISRVLIPQTFFMVLIVLHCFYEYFWKKWSVQNQAQCLKKYLNKVWNMLLPIIIILQVRSMTSVSLHELSQAEEASERLERDYPDILKRLLEKPSFRKKILIQGKVLSC